MISSVFKTLLVLVLATTAIHAKDTGVTDCAHPAQMKLADTMCTSHGQIGSDIACLCQQGSPACFMADMSLREKATACDSKTTEACVQSCNSDMIAIKCEGKKATKCLGIDPKVKKSLLSQL
ncbi:hypothetical protein BJV82DRAFT_663510 [Fennellomyces sp. T-0311]|nr:hypothetical protein BJV82DRAFT_663510 [Fennellomyces sp. T-0311]